MGIIRSLHRKASTALAVALTCAFAQARVVYVTTSGAGQRDGTSWANAYGDFAEAYADAAEGATENEPGEVWLRYGKYALSNLSGKDYCIAIQPNVIVRGGFLGTESSAGDANPDSYTTILHNGNDYLTAYKTWSNGNPKWSTVKNREVFNEPPSAGATNLYNTVKSHEGQDAFQSSNDSDLGRVEFHGIVFTMFWGGAINIAKADASHALVLRKCRFLDIGWGAQSNTFVVDCSGIGVDAKDCAFVSAQNPVRVATSTTDSAEKACAFDSCRFSTCCNNARTSKACGGITALRNVALTIRNCTFDRCLRGDNSTGAGALSVSSTCDTLIEDTVVTRGYGATPSVGGAFYYNPYKGAYLTLRRCRFETCHFGGGGISHAAIGAAINIVGEKDGKYQGLVENTAFIGNYIDVDTGDTPAASCVAFASEEAGGYSFSFVNCLFEENRAANPSSGAVYTVIANPAQCLPNAAFVNCAFKNNACSYTINNVEYYSAAAEIGTTNKDVNARYSFINTVFENSQTTTPSWRLFTDVGGKPYYKSFSFANCVTSKSSDYGTAKDGAWVANPSCFRLGTLVNGTTAGLETAPLTNGTVVARRLAPASLYRRKGCRVWMGSDRELYFFDDSSSSEAAERPWVACQTSGATVKRLTPKEAAALELSTSNAPMADAFDDARGAKTALGNLNAPVRGLRIGVRRNSP